MKPMADFDTLLYLQTIANHIQDAVYVINKQGDELFFNNKIERFEPSQRQHMLDELRSVFLTGKPSFDKYTKYITVDRREVHMLSTIIPIEKHGEIVAVCSINKNITEMTNLLNKIYKLQEQLHNYCQSSANLQNGTTYTFDCLIGRSPLMSAVINKAKKAACSPAPILLTGETGTGKEIFAQSIHNYGPANSQPFVALNCAAIPETLLESMIFGTTKGAFTGAENKPGLLEQAGRGTLFLDEINSMSLVLQAKMLRILEEKKFRRLGSNQEEPMNCRIISSSNVDCHNLLAENKMREDFFYRVAVVNLHIPPLRERQQDILLLARYFISKFNKAYGKQITRLSTDLEETLQNYSWPGNVRELCHVLENAVNFFDDNEATLTAAYLPDYFHKQSLIPMHTVEAATAQNQTLPQTLEGIERQLIIRALAASKGNITKAALALGIHRQNLQVRLKKLGITKNVQFVVK
ncbi:sigma-54 interaction domain-containing protein [Sporomusa acidovorans]|uniref:Arginine utilization regulatory protein RocR n=1 Tax=Sporomusa acidovorans (strain ATCC 49682 / DSM 3132 / Mol) TaxID=1123286 RepID=A0ABZ3J9B9_SPOA4|nr:sigma 54-interacting transcriptional regulator [Sporomusa acidovorans]OZC16076.1 arginine utilization regulatory protein RocR [Sporomusa acidovorans DSM 3132]SDD87477.1 arginine utilization regulatory protein [Sporomusa acidovorans]